MTITDADREAAQALCASGWTYAGLAFARHREQAVQEAVAERDARIEGLTIERDFRRETADLHAARIAELEGKLLAFERERSTVLRNWRVNDAFQTALEAGELTVGTQGWVTALEEIDNAVRPD